LVLPTRLVFIAMGEVLSFGFNLTVLDDVTTSWRHDDEDHDDGDHGVMPVTR